MCNLNILEWSRASTALCVDVGSTENNIIQIDLPDGSTNLCPGMFMWAMFGVIVVPIR